MKHDHAEFMMQYAKDAMETDAPWERWEYQERMGSSWFQCYSHPHWKVGRIYRRKSSVITINGHEVTEPLREEPKDGDDVFVVDLNDLYGFRYVSWNNSLREKRWLKSGLCHKTEGAAIAHSKALLSFTEGNRNETI